LLAVQEIALEAAADRLVGEFRQSIFTGVSLKRQKAALISHRTDMRVIDHHKIIVCCEFINRRCLKLLQ